MNKMKFILGLFLAYIFTSIHKFWVSYYLVKFSFNFFLDIRNPRVVRTKFFLIFLWRSIVHDISKYRWSEMSGYSKVIFGYKNITYGSEEYKNNLKKIKPSIKLHYQRNKHHPEHYVNGYQGMSTIDKIEMIADWCAAVRRHNDGNIIQSLEKNQSRFGYSDIEKEYLRTIIYTITGKF